MAATGKTRERRKWKGAEPVKGWLLVVTDAVLISPFPNRPGGPIGAEVESILAMQRRLRAHAVTVSVDPETEFVEACTIPTEVVNQEASRLATVRLRGYRSAA